MKAAYSILAPVSHQQGLRAQRRAARTRWMLSTLTLVVGVPAALLASGYLLGGGDTPLDPSTLAAQQLQLPDLPSPVSAELAVGEDMAGAPDELALTDPAQTLAPAAPPLPHRIIRLAWGDTLIGLLVKATVPAAEAHEAMIALRKVYDPREIKAGEEITLKFDDAGSFHGFEFEPSVERTVRVERHQDGDYKASSVVRPLSHNVMAATIKIEGSLYESGIKAGIPASTMSALVKALSFGIDFQREIQPGNSFKVMYEVMRNPEGVLARTGDVLYAEVQLDDRVVPVYRYKYSDGRTEYYDRKGNSVRKTLMKTPINAARISSGFGMRRHPVLGYSKMHKGMDFAAPTGTPIYAAGDGVVIERGWKNGYGNYIRLRHNGTLQTAYAHMSRFNSSVTRGSRVKQGQVIGYVGSTGRSTGPHLHFEILVNNVQVNPAKVANMNTGEALKGKNLERLKGIVAAIDQKFEKLPVGIAQDVAFSALTGDPLPTAVQSPKTNVN
jgi:murein DD-endopeptidase MepM/ murein hydrolase activator NlpD